MKYILFNYGEIFDHLEVSLNSIMSVDKNAEIILITDKNLNLPSIELVNITDSKELSEIKERLIDLYNSTNYSPQKFPVFYTSLLRVFAITQIAKEKNINEFVHFDNDVIIYKSFEEIVKNYEFDYKSLNITQNKPSEVVFGYSFFPTLEISDRISNEIFRILDNNKYYSNQYRFGNELYEMLILGILNKEKENLISILPSLPYEKKLSLLFDPSSYGQYLDGLHLRRGNYIFKRRWVSTNDIIGKEIMSKRINIKFYKNKPVVEFSNQNFDIANLHVHSKRLKKYLPYNYKQYLSLT
tara:strand:- start:9482 stop:10375 length:894 start_codon:yes stop_codon:yes gene_type:complete